MSVIYKIDILSALKKRGYSTYRLRNENILAQGVIQSLRHNKPITFVNISKICALLDCQPGDILEYNEQKEKEEIINDNKN